MLRIVQAIVLRGIKHFSPIVTIAAVLCACAFGLANEQLKDSAIGVPPAPTDFSSQSQSQSQLNSRAENLAKDRPLQMVQATVKPKQGELPTRIALAQISENENLYEPYGAFRPWMMTGCEWDAPASCHLPLFYEEPDLERLGYTRRCCLNYCGNSAPPFGDECLQSFVSAFNFIGRVPLLPYAIWTQACCEPIYTLGVDRPAIPKMPKMPN